MLSVEGKRREKLGEEINESLQKQIMELAMQIENERRISNERIQSSLKNLYEETHLRHSDQENATKLLRVSWPTLLENHLADWPIRKRKIGTKTSCESCRWNWSRKRRNRRRRWRD
jgi:hypothetical protein